MKLALEPPIRSRTIPEDLSTAGSGIAVDPLSW
jgi:hypothetical protein